MNQLMGLLLGLGLGVGLGLSTLNVVALVAPGSDQGVEEKVELAYRGSGRGPQPSVDEQARGQQA